MTARREWRNAVLAITGLMAGCAAQVEPLPPSKPCELPSWDASNCYSTPWGEPANAGEASKPGWRLICPQTDGTSWVQLSDGRAIHFPADGPYLCQVTLSTGATVTP